MKYEYTQWIKENVFKFYGQCAPVTKQMQSVFPELERVRGHYFCEFWGKREHWWLKDAGGVIVDPTKMQFPSGGRGDYREWLEGDPEPTGKCMECGGYCYRSASFCSARCEGAFQKSFT